MQLVNRSIVTGNGILSKRGMSAQKVVKAAVEMAVQQVADNASNLLIAGLAEPRQQRVQPARGQRPVPAAPQRWSR